MQLTLTSACSALLLSQVSRCSADGAHCLHPDKHRQSLKRRYRMWMASRKGQHEGLHSQGTASRTLHRAAVAPGHAL
jgi:hypothetical protein